MILKKISLKPFDTKEEKFITVDVFDVELHDTYLRKIFKGKANVTKIDGDILGAWEEIYFNREQTSLRKFFAGTERVYNRNHQNYSVIISFNGIANDIEIIFRSEAKAETFSEIILNWGLNEMNEEKIRSTI